MAITDQTSVVVRNWTGAPSITTGMRADAPEDIIVTTPTQTLVRGTHYSSTLDVDGKIVVSPLLAMPAAPQDLTITRRTLPLQPNNFLNGNTYDAEAMETLLDRTTMVAQENQRDAIQAALDAKEARADAEQALFIAQNILDFYVPDNSIAEPKYLTHSVSARALADGAIEEKLGFSPANQTVVSALLAKATLAITDFGGGAAKTAAENKAAIIAAFAALPAAGGAIYFPPGIYDCDGNIALSGKRLTLQGVARSTYLVFTAGQAGIQLTLTGGAQTLDVAGLFFMTRGANVAGKYALDVIYTPGGFNDRWQVRVQCDDVHFWGIDPKTTGWATAVRLENCNGLLFKGGSLIGMMGAPGTSGNAEADNTTSPIGLIYTGLNYPTDVVFSETKFFSYDTVAKVDGAAEGINFFDCTAVNVGMLCDWTPTIGYGGRPQFTIRGTHCNSYKGVAKLSAVQQVVVTDDNTFYHNPGATTAWIGLDLDNISDASVRGTFVTYEVNAGATTGVRVTGSQTSNIDIDYCKFGGTSGNTGGYAYENGVLVASEVPKNSVRIGKHNYFNCVYPYFFFGITTQPVGDLTFVASLAADQSIPNNVMTDITWTSLIEDGLGMWAGSAAAFTVPRSVHTVDIHLSGMLQANLSGVREVQFLKNGVVLPPSYRAFNPTTGGGHTPFEATMRRVPVTVGDMIKVQVKQSSGGALSFFASGYPRLTIAKTG